MKDYWLPIIIMAVLAVINVWTLRALRAADKRANSVSRDARRYRWIRSRSLEAGRQETSIDAALAREDQQHD